MLISTLGTGHGDHTYCRFNSSTLIKIKNHLYLFDAGVPALASLVRKGYVRPLSTDYELRGVFISHIHNDHIADVPGILKHYSKRRQEMDMDVIIPDEKIVKPMLEWAQAMSRDTISEQIHIKITHEGEIYRDENIVVRAIRTAHTDYSYAFDIEAEGKKILFTNDLTRPCDDYPQIALEQEYDLVMTELTHHRIVKILPKVLATKTKFMLFSHVFDLYHGSGLEDAKELLKDLPFPYEIAYDGFEYVL